MALAEMQAAVTVPVVKQTVECPSSADFFCIRETRGERIIFFIFGNDAKENMVQAGKERMRKLVLKYGEKPDEDDMDEADWFEYQAVKNMKMKLRER